jgi:hypothetical protein
LLFWGAADYQRFRAPGRLPESMGNLCALQHLRLDQNKLTGAIPSSFSNLTGLFSLELCLNELTGAVHML